MSLTAEGATRLVQDDLPQPRRWLGIELNLKEQAMRSYPGGAGVVYLGSSSMAAAAYPPVGARPGGRPGYNAAVLAGSLTMIDRWARQVAVPVLDPDVVVLGLTSRELNPNDPVQRARTVDFLASPAVRDADGGGSLLRRIGRRFEAVSSFIRYRSVLRQPSVVAAAVRHEELLTGEFGANIHPSGQYQGYLHGTFHPDAATIPGLRSAGLHRWAIGDEQLDRARTLVRDLRAEGRGVVVVDMPMTQSFVDAHPNGEADFGRTAATLRDLAVETGATYVNFGVWPDDLFSDAVHLNGQGAARFTIEIAPYVTASVPG